MEEECENVEYEKCVNLEIWKFESGAISKYKAGIYSIEDVVAIQFGYILSHHPSPLQGEG